MIPKRAPYRSSHKAIREVLLKRPQGLGVLSLVLAVGIKRMTRKRIERALKAMLDAYIMKWLPAPVRGGWAPIWAVVSVPEDAPKPPPRKKS